MELCEKLIMNVVRTQIDNMSRTLDMVEECDGKSLKYYSFFLAVYYQADQIKKAIEIYMEQKKESGWEMCKEMAETQRRVFEKQCEESEENK